ncbi:MAG: hypothetical protein RL490_779, partial [Pseudomonadota bacterium]
MGFTVRQIARRADGGEIIRTRTFDGAELSVGRGSDCDIQLADLGLMLRHARLRLASDGRVAVEAMGGVPLEIAGAFVTRADLDPGDNPTIMLAAHRLTLARGDAGGVLVTAERVLAAGDGSDAASEAQVFTLKKTLPSKRRLAWGLVVLILGLGLALPLWVMAGRQTVLPPAMVTAAARNAAPVVTPVAGWQPDRVWSSGPLSTAHAGLANNCGACHARPFEATTDAACIACHTPSAIPAHAPAARLARGQVPATGLVAEVHKGFSLPEGRCASCHKEHEGPDGALQVAENFCTDCHRGLAARLPDTRLANVPDWGGHPAFKPTLVVQPSLTAPRFERVTLAVARENSGLVYPHQLHLSTRNSVANMVRAQGLPGKNGLLACNYCHVPDSDGERFQPISMERNCAACHDLAFARDGSVVRTLPHGKPEQVAGIIRDFYLGQALSPRAGVAATDRRLPGSEARLRTLAFTSPAQARAQADAAIAGIFGKGGTCAECHAIADTGGANLLTRFAISPVTLADHYLPK